MQFRRRERVPLRHQMRLVAPESDAQCECVGVGPAESVAVAWRSADGSVTLATHTRAGTQAVRVTGPVAPVAAVQALPTGGFVVVSHAERNVRVRDATGNGWTGRPVNAWLFDTKGEMTMQGDLGRYVNELHVSATGAIWVGYSDQGVYDDGSGLSTHGLVRFSLELEPEWRFPQRTAVIDDCGSLNLVGESVWTCPYAEHPLICIEGDTVHAWRRHELGDVDNFAAVLVSAPANPGSVAVVATGWSHNPGLVVVGRLGTDEIHTVAERVLRLPDGSRLPEHAQIVGRGPQLHVLDGLDWYRIGLDDLKG